MPARCQQFAAYLRLDDTSPWFQACHLPTEREQYEKGTADAAIPGLLSELKTMLDAIVGKGKGKRFDIAAEYMIGRTLDDERDIAPQYGLALGEFEGGQLTIWSQDESSKQSIDLRNCIVRLDGRKTSWHYQILDLP